MQQGVQAKINIPTEINQYQLAAFIAAVQEAAEAAGVEVEFVHE